MKTSIPSHRIRGTGMFTYIYHKKSTIHGSVNIPYRSSHGWFVGNATDLPSESQDPLQITMPFHWRSEKKWRLGWKKAQWTVVPGDDAIDLYSSQNIGGLVVGWLDCVCWCVLWWAFMSSRATFQLLNDKKRISDRRLCLVSSKHPGTPALSPLFRHV